MTVKTKNIVFYMFVFCSLLAACNSSQKTSNTNMTVAKLDGTWELNYISDISVAFDSLYPNKKPIITFDISNNLTSGNTSCNNFNGPLKLDGNRISFTDQMAMTRMMCPDMKGENVFIEKLKKVNSWSVTDNNTLNLIMGDIAIMRFVKK